MSRSADILVRRLKAAGFTFQREPERLHHHSHGQDQSTFLVWDNGGRRHSLDTMLYWEFTDDRVTYQGIEMAISKMSSTSLSSFVRGTLYAMRSDFSSYGWGCLITDTPPDQWSSHSLYAELPPLKKV